MSDRDQVAFHRQGGKTAARLFATEIPDEVLAAFRRLVRKADLFGDSADRVLIGPKGLLIGRSPRAAERTRAVRKVLAGWEGGT